MIEYRFEDVAEYDPSASVRKCLNEGAQSRSMLVHLLPGQEIPPHPHPGQEVILLPQAGRATLTLDGTVDVALEPGKFYAEGEGHTFGIKNTGTEPFQMLATLVRLAKRRPRRHRRLLGGRASATRLFPMSMARG